MIIKKQVRPCCILRHSTRQIKTQKKTRENVIAFLKKDDYNGTMLGKKVEQKCRKKMVIRVIDKNLTQQQWNVLHKRNSRLKNEIEPAYWNMTNKTIHKLSSSIDQLDPQACTRIVSVQYILAHSWSTMQAVNTGKSVIQSARDFFAWTQSDIQKVKFVFLVRETVNKGT